MTLDGHIGVDWSGGPYAHEVTEEILEQLATPEMPRYIDSDELIVENDCEAGQATLWIGEVRVRMRPLDPVGADRALELAVAKMRSELTAGAHEQDS